MVRRMLSHWGLMAALGMAGVSLYLFLQDEARGRQTPRLVAPVAGDPEFEALFGSSVDHWTVGADGSYFIARLNGRLERHAPNGLTQWTLDLGAVSNRPEIDVSAMAASPLGDLFLLGLIQETQDEAPQMILARVSEKEAGPALSVVRIYEGMEPAGLAAGRDGRLYLAAMKVEQVNEALGLIASGDKSFAPFQEPFLYAADESGELIRPILSFSFDAANLKSWVDRFWEVRLVLDPKDNLYLYRVREPALERVDAEAGRIAGKIALPQAGFWDSVRMEGLQFMDDDRVLYTLHRVGADSLFLGMEARTLDIATGQSFSLSGFGAPAPPGFALYDSASDEFRGVSFMEAGSPVRLETSWPPGNRRGVVVR